MAKKPTRATMSQSWSRSRPQPYKDMKKTQMKYYMDAKLIEVGVNPKDVIYRWSVNNNGTQETWTCSAYWGESKERLEQQ
ncbi:MAG: hypothetical protein GDA44_07320 [Prochloron sp. SP5CPC1]|nr:hypothetical protein [Candidatus Paraprochloron terpiosi SP5CPC1]